MEPVDSVAVYGDCCYKELWEIAIRKQQHMEDQQETELFRKCPEISLKIHSFDFGNGMYGNVTSLEHRESISIRVRLRVRNRTFDGRSVTGCPITRLTNPSVNPPSLPNKGGQFENTWSNMMHSGQKQCSVGKRCTVAIFITGFSLWQFDVLMTERIILIFIKIVDYYYYFVFFHSFGIL